jgi:hypothetical protein
MKDDILRKKNTSSRKRSPKHSKELKKYCLGD